MVLSQKKFLFLLWCLSSLFFQCYSVACEKGSEENEEKKVGGLQKSLEKNSDEKSVEKSIEKRLGKFPIPTILTNPKDRVDSGRVNIVEAGSIGSRSSLSLKRRPIFSGLPLPMKTLPTNKFNLKSFLGSPKKPKPRRLFGNSEENNENIDRETMEDFTTEDEEEGYDSGSYGQTPTGASSTLEPGTFSTSTHPEPIGPQVTSGTLVPIIGGGGSTIGPPGPPDDLESLADVRTAGTFGRAGRGRATPLKAIGATGTGSGNRAVFKQILKAAAEEDDPNVITDFAFSNIKCFRTKNKEYFGTTIHIKDGFHLPYIRDRPQDALESRECKIDRTDNPNSFHLAVSDLNSCGVEPCGDHMCLTMVFPRVPALAVAEDEVTTIKCSPQKTLMSETQSISFAGDSLENRRSSSTVEGGMQQDFAAEVGIFRQNPGNNNGLFVRRVNSGGVVQLGEPLQLRSVVRGGDGWSHSRLSDVKVWRMRDTFRPNVDNLNPEDASEVITLVDKDGCRNTEYIVIADTHPIKDPRNDLVHHFTFKAFLFRGQRANEPLIVTAKVQACQEKADCIVPDCTIAFVGDPADRMSSRIKRAPVEIKNASSIIHDWSSHMALRVVGLKDQSSSLTENDFTMEGYAQSFRQGKTPFLFCAERMAVAGSIGALIMLILIGLVIALFTFMKRGGRSETQNFPQPHHQHSRIPPPVKTNNPQVKNMNFHPDIIRKNLEGQNKGPNSQFFQKEVAGRGGNFPISKPLPPTPKENIEGVKSEVGIKNQFQPPSKTQFTKQKEPAEYESIEDEIPNEKFIRNVFNPKNAPSPYGVKQLKYTGRGSRRSGKMKLKATNSSDGVYIVYCCNDKKKGRCDPSSAPASLRGKKIRKKGELNGETELETTPGTSEESDDSYEMSQCSSSVKSGRRTVRSIKRHQMKRGLRRRLSSFYREAYRKGEKGASFPSRAQGGQGPCRHGRHKPNDYSDCFSIQSSDLDSAYCGSMCSVGNFANNGGNIPFNNPHAPFQQQSKFQGGFSPDYSNGNPSSTNMTHFVTRNDSSTQIIIIPETNV